MSVCDEYFRCPVCGAVEHIDHWDAVGADPGKLFCNHCNREVDPEPVEVDDAVMIRTVEL